MTRIGINAPNEHEQNYFDLTDPDADENDGVVLESYEDQNKQPESAPDSTTEDPPESSGEGSNTGDKSNDGESKAEAESMADSNIGIADDDIVPTSLICKLPRIKLTIV